MGVIYLEGYFKKVTNPVRIEGQVNFPSLENYVTKEDLQLELEDKVDQHIVNNEILSIE